VNDGKQETPEHTTEPRPTRAEGQRDEEMTEIDSEDNDPQTAATPQPTERETQMNPTVLAGDTDNMDTTNYEEAENQHAGRTEQRGEEPPSRDMTPETIRKNRHASEHCPKREGDEGATENNTTPSSTTQNKEHTQTDTPGSPKRNKELKTNRKKEHTHERNRSLTRRAANKEHLRPTPGAKIRSYNCG
jgi:hypothetical protein